MYILADNLTSQGLVTPTTTLQVKLEVCVKGEGSEDKGLWYGILKFDVNLKYLSNLTNANC